MCEYTRCFLNHIVFSDGQEIDAFFFSSVEIMVEMFPPTTPCFFFLFPTRPSKGMPVIRHRTHASHALFGFSRQRWLPMEDIASRDHS